MRDFFLAIVVRQAGVLTGRLAADTCVLMRAEGGRAPRGIWCRGYVGA